MMRLSDIQIELDNIIYTDSAILIQRIWNGYSIRRSRPPLILQYIQAYLSAEPIEVSDISNDGRVNSCLDESTIIDKLSIRYGDRMHIPTKRMWYDMLLRDSLSGWIPVNIKTSSMNTNDNTGNLAMCVYAYTSADIDIRKSYQNGEMSRTLYFHLKNRQYNIKLSRDYYFLVIDKTNSRSVIINSIKGLKKITNNCNNLPFQVKWNANLQFQYKSIKDCVHQFVECIKKNKPSWKEQFLISINSL